MGLPVPNLEDNKYYYGFMTCIFLMADTIEHLFSIFLLSTYHPQFIPLPKLISFGFYRGQFQISTKAETI